MAKRNAAATNYDDEEMSSADALDALMDQDYANLPDIMETIPTGTWKLKAKNGFYKSATEDQKAKFGIFLIPMEPKSDVDPEALAAAGAAYDYTNNQIVLTRQVENLRDIKNFIEQVIKPFGVDPVGLTPREAVKKVAGKVAIASVGTRSYKSQTRGNVTENTVSNFVSEDSYKEPDEE